MLYCLQNHLSYDQFLCEKVGYLYIGKSISIDMVAFPHTPTLGVISAPATTATGQEYGSKQFNQEALEFTATFNEAELVSVLSVIKQKQNIDPVVIIPFEDSVNSALYPPRYGVLFADSYPYPMSTPGSYELSLSHRETF